MNQRLLVTFFVCWLFGNLGIRGEADEFSCNISFGSAEPALVGQFQHGMGKSPDFFGLVQDGAKQVLRLEGTFHSHLYYGDQPIENGTLEVRMRKGKGNYAGVVIRDNIRIYFQMRGALCVATDKGGVLFQSAESYKGYVDLKAVFIGPVLRVHVNGAPVATVSIGEGRGRIGLYSHGGGEGFYENFRFFSQVPATDRIMVRLESEGDALVFPPGEEARLRVVADNYGNEPAKVEIRLAPSRWNGHALEPAKTFTLQVPRMGKSDTTAVMGPFPEGFFRLSFSARLGETVLTDHPDLPLAIQRRGEGGFSPPVFPFAVYSKYMGPREPLYQNTYAHAIARLLRDHHFNAVVADPSFTREVVNIFQSYGLATITRLGAFLDHSAVIATLASDEPKPDEIENLKATYGSLETRYGKPVTTCMIGEGMGLGGENDPVRYWQKLDAKLRTFRWYGIKKSYYGTLYDLKYKGWLPLSSVLRIVEATSEIPWWFVPPAFGSTEHEGYFQNPRPSQMKALLHLALAHGADGILLWCLQGHGRGGTATALVDQRTLEPPDPKLAAVSEIGALVSRHYSLLKNLRYGHFDVGNSNPFRIEVVPWRDQDGHAYLYVVNRDEWAPASAVLTCRLGSGESLRDLYTDRQFPTRPCEPAGWSMPLTLGPGEGVLLDLQTTVLVVPPALSSPQTVEPIPETLLTTISEAVVRQGVVIRLISVSLMGPVGDGIGLGGAKDPRSFWEANPNMPRLLNWSGGLHGRSAEGYLPLASALRLAEATASRVGLPQPSSVGASPKTNCTWGYGIAFSGVVTNSVSPSELRAMIHLAIASGAQVILLPDPLPAALKTVADETATLAEKHGKILCSLRQGGLDIRCRDPRIAAIPRALPEGDTVRPGVYVINLDDRETITADLLLWSDVWEWSKAEDVFEGLAREVQPPDEEGYRRCRVVLGPGEGRYLLTDARMKEKRQR